MNYVKALNFLGVVAKEIPCIVGNGAPTNSTVGAVGCFYMNKENGDVYKCIAAQNSTYTWDLLVNNSEGGGIAQETDPTVPGWAKQPSKPKYTADEVGALPNTTKIPAKTSDITNDSGFITKSVSDLVNYYTKDQTLSKDEINAKISAIPKFSISVVSSLPTSNISGTTIYLVGGGSESDLYTEYIYTGGKWEILGSQRVDLTGYATEAWVNTQLSSYLKSSELDAAISAALEAAKESGEFDGEDGADGERGTGILSTTTGVASYTTTVNGVKPTYRILLSTLKTQASVDKVLVGDTVRYSTFLYPIITLDSEYAYMGARISLQGSAGASSEWYTGTGITGTSTTATIFSGSGVSAATVGDMYLNTSTYNTYRCTTAGAASAAKWVYVCNIKGAAGKDGTNGTDGKDYSFDPTVYGLPVLELTGDISPIKVSKDNKVTLTYVYGERSGTCTLKGQGATSYKNAQALVNAGKAGKFNYTINFDNAFEAADGWGAQKKYCLKANFIDHSHSRNVVSAKIWGRIVKSRTTANANLSGLVNGGAVDGFPIVIMLNGEFHGLYTFNIPKDGWMFGLVEDATKQQAVLGANDHELATQFKGLLAGDESDFELEFVSDEDNAGWVTTSLNRLIQSCIDSWGGDLDTTVAKYLDWDSAIDYYIWVVVCKGMDMVDKNYILTTFDGTKWCFTAYDMDSTYGLEWDGSALTRPVSNASFEECAETHRVFELIKRFKTNALKARYAELREDTLSESRMCQLFENFAWAIPSPVALEDVKLYPTIPGSFVNGIDQIGRWIQMRLKKCDEWINALPAQETPVAPEEPEEMINQVPISTDTDGSIFNGVGYKDNTRLSSSGGVSGTAQNGSVTTGFIPFTPGSTIRIKGAEFLGAYDKYGGHWYMIFYDANKGLKVATDGTEISNNTGSCWRSNYEETTGITTIEVLKGIDSSYGRNVDASSYFRMNAYGKGSDLIITVNQEIT